jgi:hypothetical protein
MAELNALRATIVGFILDGHQRRDVVEWLQENHSGIEEPGKEFDEAVRDLRKRYDEIPDYRDFCVVALRELYRRSVEIGEYKVAAGILKDIDQLATDKTAILRSLRRT